MLNIYPTQHDVSIMCISDYLGRYFLLGMEYFYFYFDKFSVELLMILLLVLEY